MSPAPELTPCLFERRLVPKVWGGRRLAEVVGLALPDGEAVGESWEVYDRPEGASALRGDAAGGRTLADLMRRPEAVLGAGVEPGPDGRFPLMLKWLDASQRLSVQVHPGPDEAAGLGDGPKDEAWVVVAAGPEARIVRGFRAGVDEAAVRAAAGTDAIEELLHAYAPRAGDVLHLPPGTVHTLGPDVVLFEVQQNSDLTWRLWDWGRPRELHLEQALRSLRITPPTPEYVTPRAVADGEELLVESSAYRVRRLRLAAPRSLATGGRYLLMTALAGRCALGWRSGGEHPPLPLSPGDTALVPACVDEVFVSPIGELQLLLTDPGAS